MKNIIFLFSLPRSGSTLLQRMLMTHEKISSANEPWLLLPLLYPLLPDQKAETEYGHDVTKNGINNLINQLPNQKNDYYQEVNHFIKNIYNKIGKEESFYFLDKTPRYYFIIPEIAKAFPDAKFIFLFRNPLLIYASICDTWRDGVCYLNSYDKMDLTKGLFKLSKGYQILRDQAIKINYESLLQNPQQELKKICQYLEIDFKPEMISDFKNSNLIGHLGDPNIKKYHALQTESLNKWRDFFNTGWRKRKAKKYLEKLSGEKLNLAGYNKKELINDVKKNKTKPLKNFNNAFILWRAIGKRIIIKIIKR